MTEKTLVILIGNSRGTHVAWDSLRRNLLKPFNADLALVFGKGEPSNVLYETAKYTKLVDEYDDWGDVVDEIIQKESIAPYDWRNKLIIPRLKGTGLWGGVVKDNVMLKGSGAIIFAFRYFVKEMIEEHDLLNKYDRFIITRSDYYYEFEHLTDLSLDNIWIPSGEEYGGITDRHIVVSNKHVIDSLLVLPWILNNRIVTTVNPETCLMTFFKQTNLWPLIKFFNRSFFTVRANTDQTRWGCNGIYLKELGVYTKYTNEYYETMHNKTAYCKVSS